MAKARRKTRSSSSQKRAMRPTWEGHLRLSLVTCPVALYSATERAADVHFNLINPKTNNRIRMQTVDAGTGRAVDRSDLVKGYAVSKNKYVLFEKEELDAVRLESTRVIDIGEFVDATSIDRIYWDEPYYLAPGGKTGIEAYAVIRTAMEKQGKVALGRLVMHQRERLMALEPRDKGIVAFSLRANREVRGAAEFFDAIPRAKPSPQMVDIATQIIRQQEGPFDPSQFNDRYEDALRALIKDKEKGRTVKAPAEPREAEVIDLMEALRRSLGQPGGGERRKPAAKAKPAARKSAARKAPAKKRA
jgi:DNA end-binding protein Ku